MTGCKGAYIRRGMLRRCGRWPASPGATSPPLPPKLPPSSLSRSIALAFIFRAAATLAAEFVERERPTCSVADMSEFIKASGSGARQLGCDPGVQTVCNPLLQRSATAASGARRLQRLAPCLAGRACHALEGGGRRRTPTLLQEGRALSAALRHRPAPQLSFHPCHPVRPSPPPASMAAAYFWPQSSATQWWLS